MTTALAVQLIVSVLVLSSAERAGGHHVIAWPLLIAGQATFLIYSYATHQIGFWPLNVGMIVIGARNWWRWTHPKLARQDSSV